MKPIVQFHLRGENAIEDSIPLEMSQEKSIEQLESNAPLRYNNYFSFLILI